jgi:hypothetical protein
MDYMTKQTQTNKQTIGTSTCKAEKALYAQINEIPKNSPQQHLEVNMTLNAIITL